MANRSYKIGRTIESISLLLVFFLTSCAPNTVVLTNTRPGNPESGVLVTDNISTLLKDKYLSNNDNFTVGPRHGNGEVIAFSDWRAPSTRNTFQWPQPTVQPISVTMNDTMWPAMTIWIVQGPFATQKTKVLTDITTTRNIWTAEKMGLSFGRIRFVDATANSKASSYTAFNCGLRSGMETDIGRDAGRINVYYVDTVAVGSSSATSNGNACEIGGSFVAMGSASGAELLAHEFGHNFALTHIDDLTSDFDTTNVMHPASSVRQYLTEGQTLRAHIQPTSAINATYGLRPGQLTRNCGRDTFSKECPEIKKRLWADGTYAAN